MTRAESNKRYKMTQKGQQMTRKAIEKYAHKNNDNATRQNSRYTIWELDILYNVLLGLITISDAAIICHRNNAAVAAKLHKIRKELGI